MSKLQDHDITRYYELLDTIPGKQINTALTLKQINKRKARKHRLKVVQLTLVIAALVFLTFASTIRFSPDIAKTVRIFRYWNQSSKLFHQIKAYRT